MSDLLDNEIVQLSDSFASYYEHIEGIDTVNGQTYDLIKQALGLESTAYSDANCIDIIENIIENYHQWHKMEAGEL
jgi:iron-sulfur cluster repair protein YtfE (RIC family)